MSTAWRYVIAQALARRDSLLVPSVPSADDLDAIGPGAGIETYIGTIRNEDTARVFRIRCQVLERDGDRLTVTPTMPHPPCGLREGDAIPLHVSCVSKVHRCE